MRKERESEGREWDDRWWKLEIAWYNYHIEKRARVESKHGVQRDRGSRLFYGK